MTLNASLLGPVRRGQAYWRDDEIRLGEAEGWKAVVDCCHMLFRKATESAELFFDSPDRQASKVSGEKGVSLRAI